MLVMQVRNTKNDVRRGLQIMRAESGTTHDVDADGAVTSQCWSPDSKQFAYETDGTVDVYDLEGNKTRVLAKGKYPTWSPDGKWIAFLDQDTYYAIRPSGEDRKTLFHKWHAQSGLWWSPDARIVAYVSQAGLLEGGFSLDVESYWLRVRRLQDNSEGRAGGYGGVNYQWVTNMELLKQAESNASPK